MNSSMTLFHNNVREQAYNPTYPLRVEIHNADDLKTVVAYDHVSAEYTDNRRKNNNFITSNCTMLDVDNNHSDSENEWVNPCDIRNAFPNVPFYVTYSRNHMKEKNGKAPRPKFHLYFPDFTFTDGKLYGEHKEKVCEYFPYFDKNAKDIAHFFYGVETPVVEFFSGEILLYDFMKSIDNANIPNTEKEDIIPEGTRNNTLHKTALKLLTRFGDTDNKAYQQFIEGTYKCSPPLQDKEITQIWNGALSYYKNTIKISSDYIPPNQYNSNNCLEPDDYSDIGQAYVFVREYGDIVKYSPATNYLYYTGKVWIENQLEVHRLVQKFTDRQIKEACAELKKAQEAEMESALNKDDIENKISKKRVTKSIAYRKFVLAKRDTLKISAVLTEAKPMVALDSSCLDSDPFMLNTLNGTVDLRSKEVHSHRSTDYCTKITKTEISNQGTELFSDFLKTITCNNKELENYLQVIAGMFAVGAVYRENIVIAYGCGRNGKSTFFNLLARVLGDYSGNISAETLTVNSKKNKSPEFAELRGKRLVIAAELQEGMRLDTAVIKKLCSTDPIYAEKKYRDPFMFIPSHTVVLYTNHLPDVGSSDEGTWRRLVVIPFNASIDPNNDIKNYADYLFNNAGGAVLSWIIEGAYKFINSNYNIETPAIVKKAIDDYRSANDWLNNYLSECCEISKIYTQNSGELYKNYRDYCTRNGEYVRSNRTFKKAVEDLGFTYKRNKNSRYWEGLRLISDNPSIDVPRIDISSLPDYVPSNNSVTPNDVINENSCNDEEVEF